MATLKELETKLNGMLVLMETFITEGQGIAPPAVSDTIKAAQRAFDAEVARMHPDIIAVDEPETGIVRGMTSRPPVNPASVIPADVSGIVAAPVVKPGDTILGVPVDMSTPQSVAQAEFHQRTGSSKGRRLIDAKSVGFKPEFDRYGNPVAVIEDGVAKQRKTPVKRLMDDAEARNRFKLAAIDAGALTVCVLNTAQLEALRSVGLFPGGKDEFGMPNATPHGTTRLERHTSKDTENEGLKAVSGITCWIDGADGSRFTVKSGPLYLMAKEAILID